MGFKAWRNLSVLAFAGVALIGCNHTDKDTKIVSAPKAAPTNTAQTNQIPPGGAGTQFPTAGAKPNAPFTTTGGTSNAASQFSPATPVPSNPFGPPPIGAANPPPFGSAPTGAGNAPPFGSPLPPLPPPNATGNPPPFSPNPGFVPPISGTGVPPSGPGFGSDRPIPPPGNNGGLNTPSGGPIMPPSYMPPPPR